MLSDSETSDSEEESTDMDACQQVLLTMNDLLEEQIFCYLSLFELLKVQAVCKIWKEVSDNVMQLRNRDLRVAIFSSTSPPSQIRFYEECNKWKQKWVFRPSIAFIGVSESKEKEERGVRYDLMPSKCKVLLLSFRTNCSFTKNSPCGILAFPDLSDKMAIETFSASTTATVLERRRFFDSVRRQIEQPNTKLLLMMVQERSVICMYTLGIMLKKTVDKKIILMGGSCRSSIGEVPFYTARHHCAATNWNLNLKPLAALAVFFCGENIETTTVSIHGYSDDHLFLALDRLVEDVEKMCSFCEDHFDICDAAGYCPSCKTQMVGILTSSVSSSYTYELVGDQYVRHPIGEVLQGKAYRERFPKIPLFGGITDHVVGALGDTLSGSKPGVSVSQDSKTIYTVLLLR